MPVPADRHPTNVRTARSPVLWTASFVLVAASVAATGTAPPAHSGYQTPTTTGTTDLRADPGRLADIRADPGRLADIRADPVRAARVLRASRSLPGGQRMLEPLSLRPDGRTGSTTVAPSTLTAPPPALAAPPTTLTAPPPARTVAGSAAAPVAPVSTVARPDPVASPVSRLPASAVASPVSRLPATAKPTPTRGVDLPTGADAAVAYARRQVGKPYLWGATGPSAFDCSGLVMRAWQAGGVRLPRTTFEQAKVGRRITRSQLLPGDLVFTNNFGHVQLYIGAGAIIEAPHAGASVRIGSLPSRVDAYQRVA
ncbi:C40 family peptidase [Planosporangium sp. 12N6]|uniref:C40 family peptidase n=1 Tax=Planosporangium spinosum TaxID=3402278 RepID=UPI003CE7F846